MRKIGTIENLTKYVIFSISVVIIYTIAEFILSTITGISHDTLTTCVYGFFGGELVLLAMIKIFKIRRTDI
jgi:hypothetical protein